jgi:hypothetical protein
MANRRVGEEVDRSATGQPAVDSRLRNDSVCRGRIAMRPYTVAQGRERGLRRVLRQREAKATFTVDTVSLSK